MESRLLRLQLPQLALTRFLPPRFPWGLTTAIVVGLTVALRLNWLSNCPLDLAPDEAHYCDWSRHLDWSYYSKGPLVAWLIRASTSLAGHSVLAVRLPAVLCGVLFVASLYVLTKQVFANRELAAITVLVALTLPPVAVMSSIMTIDAPYIACWGWALVLSSRLLPLRIADCGLRIGNPIYESWAAESNLPSSQSAIRNPQSAMSWGLLGLVVGVGILAKYTMVLFIPSLALFLVTSPGHRRKLFQPGFWIMVAVAGLCSLPLLIWNFQHDWATFRHVGGLAKLETDATRIYWLGPLVYVGGQFALLLGFWFIAWVGAMIAHRPWREPDDRLRFLWWMSAPMFLVFLAMSLKTGGGEVNWPVTAYVSGLVLMVGWLARTFQSATPLRRRLIACGFASACGLGIALSLLLHHSHSAYPVLGPLSDRLFPEKPLALRRIDPTCRLRGWQTLSAEVDALRAQLRAEGTEPILAAAVWWMPGELAFYCEGRPTVYSLGLTNGDRHSQYDLWRPNPVSDPATFQGKTFILVGDFPPEAAHAFKTLRPPVTVEHRVGGRLVAEWSVRVAEGFRGFPTVSSAAH